MTWRHFHGGVLWENLPTTTCWFIEASTVLVREIATTQGVQIFGSVASSRSRLHVAMRNPRQPAALRQFAPAGRKHGETPGGKPKFGLCDSGRLTGAPAANAAATSGLSTASCPGFEPLKRATAAGLA
jgi:hypothetical protein